MNFSRYVFLIVFSLLLSLPQESEAISDLNIPLVIKETLGINRPNEMVHNGIPIDKDEQLVSTSDLVIEDSQGIQIPATFEVLSRWGSGKEDESKSIQWMLVSFPASVDSNATKIYYLKKGVPLAPVAQISITEEADVLTVNTGPAKFVISKTSFTLFDLVSINDQGEKIVVQNNGGSHSMISGQSLASANPPEEIIIERQDEHYVCILLKGTYNNSPVGADVSSPLSYKIRYEFFAGSPMVVVYHKFSWLGSNGSSMAEPITIDNVSLSLPDMPGYQSTDVYADEFTSYSGTLLNSETAFIQQKLRVLFADPHEAEVLHGTNSQTTSFTTRPMLLNHSINGVMATTIDHMQYFEPQSVGTDADGKITVNVMSENQDFAAYQGTWARVGIAALPVGSTYSNALSENFAPLNNRLFAFPSNEYVRASKVFLEVPSTPNAQSANEPQIYYDELKSVTETTRSWLETEKWQGLMTWGSLTRYPNETGTGEGWDKIYAGAKHTDYHNAWNNVVFQFLLEGDPALLDDLAFMGARRMLHTQIIQPDDEVSNAKMGWGFSGYGRYRADANSSHSYFENLYNYYYLTGDKEVIDVIKAGAGTLRNYYTRDNGALNNQDIPGTNWIDYTGRPAYQFASMANFIGHVEDSNYLDDFKHMYDHAFSHSIALLFNGDGKEYGFVSTSNDVNSGFRTEQFWMMPLYFMHGLYILHNEYGDISLGSDNLSISRVYEAVSRGAMEYASKIHVSGNGNWDGRWINSAYVNYSGGKIGGTISLVIDVTGGDSYLYPPGKSIVTTLMLRAGSLTNQEDLTIFGKEGLQWLLNTNTFQDSDDDPWGKVNAQMFIRLHHSMAYFTTELDAIFRDGFESGTL